MRCVIQQVFWSPRTNLRIGVSGDCVRVHNEPDPVTEEIRHQVWSEIVNPIRETIFVVNRFESYISARDALHVQLWRDLNA